MNLAEHRNTPLLEVYDGRGLSIRQVAYLRKVEASVESLITRQGYDVAGRVKTQCDPRLAGSPRPNLTNVHGLSGQAIKVDSVDAGWRLNLPGMAGEILQRWDERGNQWRNTYDEKLRLLTVDENAQTNVEVFTYAQGDAEPGNNLRSQLCKKVDPSGSVEFKRFSLHGLPFEEVRTPLDDNVYTTTWSYGATSQPLNQTDAGGHQQLSRYDIAGQLKQVTLQINADGPVLEILEDAQYNAAGQTIEQLTGNKVARTWIYDLADGRLTNMEAGVPGQPLLQNLEYFYDPVGNVLGIDDHMFKPVFFANQYIDGHREFTYDSLYRLISATGHDDTPSTDMPGRPLPSDPNNHLNYKQLYDYDPGGNLIKLTHTRAVGGYTHQMRIDPSSNRGVRWKPEDPEPNFETLFDRHGNLQTLQPGQTLFWNNRDEPSSITLIERQSSLDDKETYRYSNGERIYKRHETHTLSTTHFHEVLYLNGLEIRTRETGEALHVITLPSSLGRVRCLHWVSNKPDDIDNNQVRYILDDNLGSSLTELDQHARPISHEEYYPFGGTAFLTRGSVAGISYKTIRYSGKEMDDTGLYYYGRRYYAPWLQRWVSADPAGDVDGLNLYAMVRNNPMTLVDKWGLAGDFSQHMSNRTTSILTTYTLHPPPTGGTVTKQKKAAEDHYKKVPDARFSKKVLGDLVAHAGFEYSDGNPENTVSATDVFNISLPKGGVAGIPGVSIHKPFDAAMGSGNPANLGILKVEPHQFLPALNKQYETAFNDKTFPVKIYKESTKETVDMSGVEYEASPLHPLTRELVESHITQSGGYIPQGAGLPGFHAEVKMLNIAALMIPNLGQQLDNLTIVTQKLVNVKAATAFPGCFNCANILVNSYNGGPGVNIPTGRADLSHTQWKKIVEEYPG
ncbi:RHS repeat-associated core domain-containing protein [Pseudomonas sp. HLT2-19-2]